MIDWEIIATELGALHEGGEHGSSTLAKQAIENCLEKITFAMPWITT